MCLKIIFISLVIFVSNVSAAIISEDTVNTVFDSGRQANLQGLEWLSLNETLGQSRISIEAGYNNFVNEGWRYASRSETEILFGSLWGGIYSGYSANNYVGANWFHQVFGTSDIGSNATFRQRSTSTFIFGNNFDCSNDVNFTCLGNIGVGIIDRDSYVAINVNSGLPETINLQDNPENRLGFFREDLGVNMGFSNENRAILNTASSPILGSLLVRNIVNVSEPHSIFLLLIALIFLLVNRFKLQ